MTSTASRPRALHLELDAYPPAAIARLRSVLDVVDGSALDVADLPDALEDGAYEVLLVRLGTRIDASVIAQAPTLRLVVTPTTGLDHLDVDALTAAGIRILSLRDARTAITGVHATAELTWALLLACVRHVPRADADVAAGHWRRQRYLGTELSGRTIGIIGHGRLGRRVAGYARAFGMQVLVHDIDPDALSDLDAMTTAVDAETLLRSADVVSLHLPLDDATRGWLEASRVALLREGAVVINTARGELVDEHALARSLADGHLGGIAVDVVADDANWGSETGRSPLLELRHTDANLVITPHIGGWARDAVATTRNVITGLTIDVMAEGGGFEPPRDVTPNTDSSRAP